MHSLEETKIQRKLWFKWQAQQFQLLSVQSLRKKNRKNNETLSEIGRVWFEFKIPISTTPVAVFNFHLILIFLDFE